MIEIKLTEEDALQYIQNEKLQDANYDSLLEIYNKLLADFNELQEHHKALSKESKKISSKALKDSEIIKHTDGRPKKEFNHVATEPTKEEPVKYKSRLNKKDRAELDTLAKEKFRSNAKLEQFAKKRNLRPVTVKTYIDKHSEGKYRLILGDDIREYQKWPNAVIEKRCYYITEA